MGCISLSSRCPIYTHQYPPSAAAAPCGRRGRSKIEFLGSDVVVGPPGSVPGASPSCGSRTVFRPGGAGVARRAREPAAHTPARVAAGPPGSVPGASPGFEPSNGARADSRPDGAAPARHSGRTSPLGMRRRVLRTVGLAPPPPLLGATRASCKPLGPAAAVPPPPPLGAAHVTAQATVSRRARCAPRVWVAAGPPGSVPGASPSCGARTVSRPGGAGLARRARAPAVRTPARVAGPAPRYPPLGRRPPTRGRLVDRENSSAAMGPRRRRRTRTTLRK